MSNERAGPSSDYEEVTLEVEGTLLKCNKRLLINNSDYFRIMLEGNFREKNQSKIALKVGIFLKMILLFLYQVEKYEQSTFGF